MLCRTKAPKPNDAALQERMRNVWNSVIEDYVACAVQRGREYLQELRRNRINPFWHKDPPVNTCPMPSDNMPWRPEVPHY